MFILSWIDDSVVSQLNVPGDYSEKYTNSSKSFIIIPGTDKLFLKDEGATSVIVSFKDGLLAFPPDFPKVTTN